MIQEEEFKSKRNLLTLTIVGIFAEKDMNKIKGKTFSNFNHFNCIFSAIYFSLGKNPFPLEIVNERDFFFPFPDKVPYIKPVNPEVGLCAKCFCSNGFAGIPQS